MGGERKTFYHYVISLKFPILKPLKTRSELGEITLVESVSRQLKRALRHRLNLTTISLALNVVLCKQGKSLL